MVLEVNATARPLYLCEKDPVPNVQAAEWALVPVWTGAENFAPNPPGFSSRSVHPVASHYTHWAIPAIEAI